MTLREIDIEIDSLRRLKANHRGYVMSQVFMGDNKRIIDIATLSKDGILITYEIKLTNWRHAMEQAQDHCYVGDYSYVVMPEKRITKPMRAAFNFSTIGLLFYNMPKEEYKTRTIRCKWNTNIDTSFPFRQIFPAIKNKTEPVYRDDFEFWMREHSNINLFWQRKLVENNSDEDLGYIKHGETEEYKAMQSRNDKQNHELDELIKQDWNDIFPKEVKEDG